MNLRLLKRSRHYPKSGDTFYLQIKDGSFHWGRVVSTTASVGGFDDCILIYIYKDETYQTTTQPEFDKSRLLVPPIATNRRPWTMGYFVHHSTDEISKRDLLKTHCFYDPFRKRYCDDSENVLKARVEPCGEYGLDSFRTIDDKISDALGIELAADE